MMLDAFETLVLSQQPATRPWTPVTDYSVEARTAIEGPHPQLIKETFQPIRALDVGCGTGFLVTALRAIDVEAFGCDLMPSPPIDPWFMRIDITRSYWPLYEGEYDLVICREVLEHLPVLGIAMAVRHLCKLSSRYVYVTTRFHPDPQSLLDVATSDDLDPTHISMLNQDFLRVLFVLEGYRRREDLEQQMDWKTLHRVLVYERA